MPNLRDLALRFLPDLLSAFVLLTRLPLPQHSPTGAGSAWAWPVVGAALGAVAGGVTALALWLGLTPGVCAVLALATLVVLTGGLHEDGLSDTADGFFGGWTRQRRLEIMKDSRVGTFGVLALVLVALARWSALTALVVHGNYWAALIAAGALSRVPMVLMLALLPNARGEGLAHDTGTPPPPVALAAGVVATLIATLATGWLALALVFVVLVVMVLVSVLTLRRIGGQTGDVLGASQQVAEVACLAILSAVAD